MRVWRFSVCRNLGFDEINEDIRGGKPPHLANDLCGLQQYGFNCTVLCDRMRIRPVYLGGGDMDLQGPL